MSASVQGTNDSCTLSKAAMISKGYFEDLYVKNFASTIANRSPIINRGYYIRAHSIQTLISHLITGTHYTDASGKKVCVEQVVCMGAGFDTLYFRLRDLGYTKKLVKYIEVDVLSVIEKKKKIIDEHKMLLPCDKGVYEFVMEDMRDTDKMFQSLIPMASPKYLTLFLCEVSLVYLPSFASDRILQVIASVYDRSVTVLYEQLNTKDTFGKFMMKHFKKLNCPLGSPEEYSSIESVVARMSGSFPKIVCADINHVMFQSIPLSELRRISQIELFDELEELYQLNSHYALTVMCGGKVEVPADVFPELHGMKCQCCLPKTVSFNLLPQLACTDYIMQLNVFKHCSVLINTRLFLVGGFGNEIKASSGSSLNPHSRLRLLADMVIKDNCIDDFKFVKHRCWERVGAVMGLCGNQLIVFGGRRAPNVALNDIVMITVDDNSYGDLNHNQTTDWENCNYPSPRYRHCCSVIKRVNEADSETDTRFYVDGGKNMYTSFDDGFVYNPIFNTWSVVNYIGEKLPPRYSHSICAWTNMQLILSGGIINGSETEISGKLYLLQFSTSEACSVQVFSDNIAPVFGHTSHVYTDSNDKSQDWLLLVGGVAPISSFSLVQLFDLKKKLNVRQIRLEDCLAINHTSHLLNHHLLIVGGGGNLFSFGTHFNASIKCYSVEEMLKIEEEIIPSGADLSANSDFKLNTDNATKEEIK